MQLKSALVALAAAGIVSLAATLTTPAGAMGSVGPQAVNKTDASVVEKVHRRWRHRNFYRRGYYAPRYYYPRYRYRPYYYSYSDYDDHAPYYYRPYRPYYGGYFRPRFYGYGGIRIYGPRFGIRIGW